MRTKEKEAGESKHLISEIKNVCEKLGWSQKECARRVYVELHEDDNESDIKAFTSSFVKQLQRPSTDPKRLKSYLSAISRDSDFQRSDFVLNKYVPLGHLSDFMQKEMLEISKKLAKKLQEKERRME